MDPALTPRRVAATVDEMLAGATEREAMHASDSKSGARFERVVLDGERYVVKYLSRDDDWIMRATGDLTYRPLLVWQTGLVDLAPDCIDHAYAGSAHDGTGAAILLYDVGEWLIPVGDTPLPLDVHLGFMEHLAAFHASTLGFIDPVGLCPLANRFSEFSPAVVDCEAALGFPEAVPRVMRDGWARFPDRAPRGARAVLPLLDDPSPLVRALETLPTSFLQGDWKMGNLGRHADGRTILIDWANPGAGPGVIELTWYLALNRARLPTGHTKEDAINTYRNALERLGVDTAPWWDRALSLAFLGALVQFGWEKALGDSDELAWWERRAVEGARYL
ncbi:MAG: aminoglycoside phosphotransferase [Acidimicrobiia bacterium]